MQETEKIWMNGELVDWADATFMSGSTVSTTAAASSRGSAAYETPKGPAVFRLEDHMRRLHDSRPAPLHGHPLLRRGAPRRDARPRAANGLPAGYIRPIAFFGYGRSVSTRGGTRSRR